MRSPELSAPRVYGLRRVMLALIVSSCWTLLTLGLVVAAVVENFVQGRFEIDSEWFPIALFGTACLMFPVAILLSYSPRTRSSHISVGTHGSVPALALRQSRSIFATEVVFHLGLAGFFSSMIAAVHEPGDPIGGSIVVLVVTCGWQTCYLTLVLLGRLRPGSIAIRADGIAFTNRASDTWIPWEAVQLNSRLLNPTHADILVDDSCSVTVVSRVPRPWRRFDSRPPGDVQPSPGKWHGRVVSIDRRYFRIAPELIDSALLHYIANPDARHELTNPNAIAQIVAQLRGHAPGPWWRSYRTPVSVPVLTSPAALPDREST
ncbi:MAG: hypothetical protein WAX14_11660 [Rhodococcus sp. (in: high G+C Gram-positive bacteria)]|uniref:hypothetical protein n=1 Tax=Rhodococcus sp. TaxID=1831 RepID=UPI003BB75EF5